MTPHKPCDSGDCGELDSSQSNDVARGIAYRGGRYSVVGQVSAAIYASSGDRHDGAFDFGADGGRVLLGAGNRKTARPIGIDTVNLIVVLVGHC